MAYWIDESCIGCTVCAPKCPTGAISGATKKLHVIDPVLCIDCGVCASVCPVDLCIFNPAGYAAPKIKPAGRPVAVVYPDRCTGCRDCVDICPERCLEMTPDGNGLFFAVARMANAKTCTACKECERVCSDKRAILVEWPDGAWCESLGQVPEKYVAPRKAAAVTTR